MADFVSDSFTEASDVAATSHSPETGGSWAYLSGTSGTGTVVASEDRVRGDATLNNAYVRNTATPPSADYFAQAKVRWTVVNDVTQLPGVLVRASDSAFTAYYVRYLGHATPGTRQWQLRKIVAGSDSALGSYVEDLPTNTDYTVRLEVEGTSLRVYVDGVLRISATDSSITGAGYAGYLVRFDGRVDDFLAGELEEDPPATPNQPIIFVCS